ncbi:hypothetical protein POTOM_021939 [Populus tomentosa]|uniref:Uncharacterized protein n=1 Tax=Populus tomentosa TaxID=118781 RepID=A0A8X8D1D1_POPTO|nr:hypothetical protein POTOM_021939 [Populus tomentosa]
MFKNGLVVTNEHQGLDLEQQAACVDRYWIMILEVRDVTDTSNRERWRCCSGDLFPYRSNRWRKSRIYLLMLQPTCVALSQEQDVSERFFVHPPENVQNPSSELTSIITGLQIPVIDFEGLESGPRLEDLKMELYTHDRQCPVRFYSNGDLLRGPACWRDTVAFNCEECNLNHLLFPEIFRKEVSDYTRQTIKMRKPLSELISEAI